MRLDRPPEQRVTGEELIPEGLAISGPGPELLTASDPPHSPQEETREDDAEGRIEPDQRVGAWQHKTLRATPAVVAVDDPGVAFDRASDALLEDFDRHERPVLTPGERVELDVRHAEPTRELTRECGLARAGRADDGDALQGYLGFVRGLVGGGPFGFAAAWISSRAICAIRGKPAVTEWTLPSLSLRPSPRSIPCESFGGRNRSTNSPTRCASGTFVPDRRHTFFPEIPTTSIPSVTSTMRSRCPGMLPLLVLPRRARE